jgi:hypothetical protein
MSAGLENTVQQYLSIDEELKLLSKRKDELKKRLLEIVEAEGDVDGKGHMSLEVGDVKLVRQRKTSNPIDMAIAERIIAEKHLEKECIKMIPQLDSDAIMAAYYKELITEQEIDEMFPLKVNYAFLVNTK